MAGLSVRRSRLSALLGDREALRRCGLYWYFARLRGKLDPRSDGGFDPDESSCRSRGRASAPSPTSTMTPDGTSARGLAPGRSSLVFDRFVFGEQVRDSNSPCIETHPFVHGSFVVFHQKPMGLGSPAASHKNIRVLVCG